MAAKRFHLLKFVHFMTVNQISPKTACFEYKRNNCCKCHLSYTKINKENPDSQKTTRHYTLKRILS